MIIRGIVGTAFILVGAYVGYFATHPINNIALGIAAALFIIGGCVIDLDDMSKALYQLAQTKLTLPSKLP